jgi:hypothetical protein
MILIAIRLVLQYFSGKQAFPPERYKPLRIKVTGMQTPQPH